MKIHLVWAIVEDEHSAPWLIAAWDEYCIEGNYDGWVEELAKARNEHGAANIRETTISADYDKVVQAFKPSDVTPDVAA